MMSFTVVSMNSKCPSFGRSLRNISTWRPLSRVLLPTKEILSPINRTPTWKSHNVAISQTFYARRYASLTDEEKRLRELFRDNTIAETKEAPQAIPEKESKTPKEAEEEKVNTVGQKTPTPALLLGIASLVPLAAGAAGGVWLEPHLAASAIFYQLTYGASILSMLGAVHWGTTMANFDHFKVIADTQASRWAWYTYSTVPSLLAWVALTRPPVEGFGILLAGFTSAYAGDIIAGNKGLLPAWYIRSRLWWTILVLLLLGTSFILVERPVYAGTVFTTQHLDNLKRAQEEDPTKQPEHILQHMKEQQAKKLQQRQNPH